MKHLEVKLAKRIAYLQGRRKYWWKIKHKSSSGSEEATDTRIWYTDSKKHGYLIEDDRIGTHKLEISKIEQLAKLRGEMDGPIDWIPAEHRITTLEKLARLNKLVDRAEEEQRKQEAKKHKAATDVPQDQEEQVHGRQKREGGRPMKPPPFERIARNKLKSGKFIWHRNKDGSWFRIESLHSKKGKPVPKTDWDTLDQIFSELRDPIPTKNPGKSSKRKRPGFAERNKHGGLIVHGLANSSYYTRFDIRKSTKYPSGFTFRMGRGKLYILETLDRESLAAIEKEISWILRS